MTRNFCKTLPQKNFKKGWNLKKALKRVLNKNKKFETSWWRWAGPRRTEREGRLVAEGEDNRRVDICWQK